MCMRVPRSTFPGQETMKRGTTSEEGGGAKTDYAGREDQEQNILEQRPDLLL